MTNVWCVRAKFGEYTQHFVKGGYVAIGWLYERDLSTVRTRDELYPLYRAAYPEDESNVVVGQQVGQIARFLLEVRAGDIVVAPDADSDLLYFGEVQADPSYFHWTGEDGCPFRHRRRTEWVKKPLRRSELSVPLQNTLRSSLTVFAVPAEPFLAAIGRGQPEKSAAREYDPYRVVIDRVLQLDAREFEELVGHLLTAMGFEGTQVTGKSGDGGVDAIGELNVATLAKIKIFVQAKRYQTSARISPNVVRQLRQAIPRDGQGAFITTADYQPAAYEVAHDPNFPRIGLVTGHQLVDLLVEHWDDIPEGFREKLGLRPGLVKS
jgi:predicted Mrr-cat superfamily restriction endonuclease